MSIAVNRGMYLEEIIRNTAKYYLGSGRIMIFKRELPLRITKFLSQKEVIGQIVEKPPADYFGIFDGFYFEFEAKQTISDKFVLSNLREHQFAHLGKIWNMKGLSFLLVYFANHQRFFLVEYPQISTVWKKEKTLPVTWFQTNAKLIELLFPGYLDLLQYFEGRKSSRDFILRQ